MEKVRCIPGRPAGRAETGRYGYSVAEKVRAFHRTFPGYCETPLTGLGCMASELGIRSVFIKDESCRFGLNAFKVLGGSYAIGSYIAEKAGIDRASMSYEQMTSAETDRLLGDTVFITATDGNHGRGVAWTAERLGRRCVVYMPKGTAEERLDNILKLGAEAYITDMTYDDAVRKAAKDAEDNGWILVQDTSHPGYEEIPERIMQGYTTMALEAVCQLGDTVPTHVFLQAGVGSMAGAVAAFLADYYKEKRPVITIVEPDTAACVFNTAAAGDGKLHPAEGEMNTIMAGLACGEVCGLAWEMLSDYADFYMTVPDSFAADGMRALAHPDGDDAKIVSGESGASGFGTVYSVLKHPEFAYLKEQLGLDENSVVLCFSTEGATDRENYRRITGE